MARTKSGVGPPWPTCTRALLALAVVLRILVHCSAGTVSATQSLVTQSALCYRDDSINGHATVGLQLLADSPNNTHLACAKLANSQGYRFSVTQSGSLCFGSNDYARATGLGTISNWVCGSKCTGDAAYMCGGVWYSTLSSGTASPRMVVYHNCIRDIYCSGTTRCAGTVLASSDATMTNQKCLRLAQEAGFHFASTALGSWCMGSNDAGNVFAPTVYPTECSVQCMGDLNSYCGGGTGGRASTYEITGLTEADMVLRNGSLLLPPVMAGIPTVTVGTAGAMPGLGIGAFAPQNTSALTGLALVRYEIAITIPSPGMSPCTVDGFVWVVPGALTGAPSVSVSPFIFPSGALLSIGALAPPSDGGITITRYEVLLALPDGGTGACTLHGVTSGVVSISVLNTTVTSGIPKVANLCPESMQRHRLRRELADVICLSVPPVMTSPPAITIGGFDYQSGASATVSWSAAFGGSVDSYELRALSADATPGTNACPFPLQPQQLPGSFPPTTLSVIVRLCPGHKYGFGLKACNDAGACGTEVTAYIGVAPVPPSSPAPSVVLGQLDTAVGVPATLTWSAPWDGGLPLTKLKLETTSVKTTAAIPTCTYAAVPISQDLALDQTTITLNLCPGYTYSFKISACNGIGVNGGCGFHECRGRKACVRL
eukprot:tig00020629_g12386.t1